VAKNRIVNVVVAYVMYKRRYEGNLLFKPFCDFWKEVKDNEKDYLLEHFILGRPYLNSPLAWPCDGFGALTRLRIEELTAPPPAKLQKVKKQNRS
jgi:hypothetical protein